MKYTPVNYKLCEKLLHRIEEANTAGRLEVHLSIQDGLEILKEIADDRRRLRFAAQALLRTAQVDERGNSDLRLEDLLTFVSELAE